MSGPSKQNGESISIDSIESDIKSAKIRLTRSGGKEFFLEISIVGFKFYDAENSGGTLRGKPVVRTPDEIFEWVKKGKSDGGRIPFGERASQKPKRP
jgi:hypothetical protein